MGFSEVLFPPIVNKEGGSHILAHKYVSGGKSLIMPALDIWWEFAVKFVPKWIAPNVLTLIGSLFQVIAFYVYMYYEPNLNGTYQSFGLYLYLCFSLFAYHTLDAIDGKHARNTNNSSPLGQLFDHGCDAIIMTLGACIGVGQFSFGTSWQALYIIILGQIGFYAPNWRARHVGKFDFDQISIDEFTVMGMIVLLITGFYGPQLWQSDNTQMCILMLTSLQAVYIWLQAFYDVNKHYGTVNEGKDKRKFYEERFYELGNLMVFQVSLLMWNLSDVFTEFPTLFVSTIALCFAHLVHRLIICDVTKQKSRKLQYIILPFVMVGILSGFEYYLKQPIIWDLSMKDVKVVIVVFVYTAYIMFVYAIRCMIDISNILDIRIFLINPPKIKTKSENYIIESEITF